MSLIKNTRKSRADSDALGRFYTSTSIARLLVDKLLKVTPGKLLDLGCGSGNLAKAALAVWPQLDILTVDVDDKVPEVVSARLCAASHRHVQADVLAPDLAQVLEIEEGAFDVAVCNPPFVRPVWQEGYTTLLEKAGFTLEHIPAASQVQADILFLAQNIRLLADQGWLGFIAPASFVSGKPYRAFRAALLEKHRVHSVVRLPRNAFAQADARAFIVIIQKGLPTDGLIPVTNLSPAGVESQPLWIEASAASVRLDGGPEDDTGFADLATPAAGSGEALADVVVSLVRGSFKPGATAAAQAPHPLFHTTHFPEAPEAPAYAVPVHLNVAKPNSGVTVGETDDILIARVGRNLHRKICRVAHGKVVVTDNVFRIRVKPGQSQRVFEALTSASGQAWLSRAAYGVGARHITKTDLLKFPLP